MPESLTSARLAVDLLMVIGATVLSSLACAAVALYTLRRRAGDRALLWFTAFAVLYALRLFATTAVVPYILGGPDAAWELLRHTLTYVMPIPLLYFAEWLLGPGPYGLIRRFRRLSIAFAIVAIAGIPIAHDPGWALIGTNVLVLLMMPAMVLLLPAIAQSRSPHAREGPATVRLMQAGILVATGFIVAENLRSINLLNWPEDIEFIGFVALAISLAYSVTERFLGNEGRLAAIDREMETAQRIQSSILPREVPVTEGFRIHARYLPMTAVAGDFYEFFLPAEGQPGVLVADVSGHGVPAAMIASMVKVAATSHRDAIGDPGRLLALMNRTLDGQLAGQFVTAICVACDRRAGRVTYAGAGHPPVLHWRAATRTLDRLDSTGVMLGPFPDAVYTTGQQGIASGDRLALYTDGLLEATNDADEMFGDERFPALFAEHASLPGDEFADTVLRELTRWSGRTTGFDDDVTLVIVDVL